MSHNMTVLPTPKSTLIYCLVLGVISGSDVEVYRKIIKAPMKKVQIAPMIMAIAVRSFIVFFS